MSLKLSQNVPLQQKVLQLYLNKFSVRQIAELTNISKSSVGRLVVQSQLERQTQRGETSLPPSDMQLSSTTLYDKFKGLSWLDFWKVLEPPTDKQGQPTECWDYELHVIKAIEDKRLVACNKARGIGLTELALRWILYMCLSRQIAGNYVIVCGNTFEIARSLMRRMKAMLYPHNIWTDDKETVLSLPGCRIQAFSSEVNSFRSLTDVRFILADEVDSLDNGQDIRAVIDAYSVKTNAQIVLCSTPGQIDSTMHRLFKEQDCLYHRMTLDYHCTVGKLYSLEEIEYLQRTMPAFKREFCCLWGYVHEGSSFTDSQIQRATSIPYSLEPMPEIDRSLGCDPGYTSGLGGGGAFGICITEQTDGKIKVMYSHTFKEVEHSDIVAQVVDLMEEYNIYKVWVDANAVSFIHSLKEAITEDPDWKAVFERQKQNKLPDKYKYDYMRVCPINFGTKRRELLSHAKALMSDGLVAINPDRFGNLIAALQTAKDRDDSYIKEDGLFTDEFDAWTLCINKEQYEL